MPDPGQTNPAPGCTLCPRQCLAGRTSWSPGRCGAREAAGSFRVARLMVHHWEEPMISGTLGSGAVFFSGCNLGCLFCQNAAISLHGQGSELGSDQLAEAILQLAFLGVHNLNLVTASHYADRIPDLISRLRQAPLWQERPLPVVWNSSAYETVASLESIAGCIDIYLPDLKYFSSELAQNLAGAADYFAAASRAVLEMHRQQPKTIVSADGTMKQGLIVRHLVLPGHWRDSLKILDFLAANLPLDTPLSLMSQYTPPQGQVLRDAYPEMGRRLTSWEYSKVIDHALDLGFLNLLGQHRSAADPAYTPDFSSLWGAGLRGPRDERI